MVLSLPRAGSTWMYIERTRAGGRILLQLKKNQLRGNVLVSCGIVGIRQREGLCEYQDESQMPVGVPEDRHPIQFTKSEAADKWLHHTTPRITLSVGFGRVESRRSMVQMQHQLELVVCGISALSLESSGTGTALQGGGVWAYL